MLIGCAKIRLAFGTLINVFGQKSKQVLRAKACGA
jgi:hypothetical protein